MSTDGKLAVAAPFSRDPLLTGVLLLVLAVAGYALFRPQPVAPCVPAPAVQPVAPAPAPVTPCSPCGPNRRCPFDLNEFVASCPWCNRYLNVTPPGVGRVGTTRRYDAAGTAVAQPGATKNAAPRR